MAGSKDEREVAPAASATNGSTSASGAGRAPPLPRPAAPPPSSRNVRAAAPVREGAVLYSHVGRRSSPGFPAQPVAVESVRAPVEATSAPAHARAAALPPIDLDLDESSSADRTAAAGHSRPPAPDAFQPDPSDGESIAQTLDRLLVAGEGLVQRASSSFPREELTGPRELFGTLAAAHVRPVRDLVIGLQWGQVTREDFVTASGAVQSLRSAAEKLSLQELVTALGAFAAELASAEVDHASPASRTRLMAAHAELVRLLPAAFAIESERAQRETHIVQSIVLQVPDANRTTLERVVGAGLVTIASLADAQPRELAEVTGIALAVAQGIVDAARAHRERRQEPVDAHDGGDRVRLRALCTELASQQTAFERASDAWSLDATAEKRRLRGARERTMLEIAGVLAQIGEIPLLEQIEKVPFEQKVARLRSYLGGAAAAP